MIKIWQKFNFVLALTKETEDNQFVKSQKLRLLTLMKYSKTNLEWKKITWICKLYRAAIWESFNELQFVFHEMWGIDFFKLEDILLRALYISSGRVSSGITWAIFQ